MKDLSAARKYARALFELAKEKNELDAAHDCLAAVKQVFKEIPEFRAFIFSYKLETRQKVEGLSAVFGDLLTPLMADFFRTLINNRRQDLICEVADMFAAMARDERNRVLVTATTYEPMKEEWRAKVTGSLHRALEKEVLLESEVDPGIIGGIVMRIGNRVIDGSIRGNLKRLREGMLG